MKKIRLIIIAAFINLLPSLAKAADPNIFFSLGKLNLYVPFTEIKVTSLYDFVGQSGLVGAETPIFGVWKLQFTAGAITSLDGEGSPFVGANLELQNPLSNFVPITDLKPGVFGGRDFNKNSWIYGIKVAKSIF